MGLTEAGTRSPHPNLSSPGYDRAIQGNLDPTLLLGPIDRVLAGADDVITRAAGRAGHVFNLGHGLLPSTPIEHVQALARHVHQHTRQ